MTEHCASDVCPRHTPTSRRLCGACYRVLPFQARVRLTSDVPAFRNRALADARQLLRVRASGDRAFHSAQPRAR